MSAAISNNWKVWTQYSDESIVPNEEVFKKHFPSFDTHHILNLNYGSWKWQIIYPADLPMGWRVGNNVVANDLGYFYISNDQGFMSTGDLHFHYDVKKPPQVFRIIVLGGSTVFGQGVILPEDNLPAQIKQVLLQSRPERQFEVINAGVGGYFSGQELLYLVSELTAYEPDLVIVYDGWNDYSNNNDTIAKYGALSGSLRTPSQFLLADRLMQSYTVKGSFSHLISNMLARNKILRRFWILAQHAPKQPPPRYLEYFPESVLFYRRNLELMLSASRSGHFKIGFFLQPIVGVGDKEVTSPWLSSVPDLSRRRLFYKDARKMFVSLQHNYEQASLIGVSDLSQVLQKNQSAYTDTGHLNAEGNKIVANRIVDELMKKHLIPD
jgi:lysophospholipase L1-like esterase